MKKEHLIARLKDTALLLELHEANPFQVRHYRQAALQLEKLSQKTTEGLADVTGLTPGLKQLIQEVDTKGTLSRWEELTANTPQGVRDMLGLRGIGPKKVGMLWRQLGIEHLPELLRACKTGKVAQLPGFGVKTQDKILASLAFRAQQAGKFHYAKALPYADDLIAQLQQAFPEAKVSQTGALRRKLEVIAQAEILIGTVHPEAIVQWLNQQVALRNNVASSGPFSWRGQFVESDLGLVVLFCHPQVFYQSLILQTGSPAHLALPVQEGKSLGALLHSTKELPDEATFYESVALPYVPPELREGQIGLTWAREAGAPELLRMQDLRGVFHNHTTYSDGKDSLEAMARHCMELGYEYIGVSDHSQQAFYAGGLTTKDIQRQHEEIDRLNELLTPFKIFKGIEADVLTDGCLDYTDDVLAHFDFVIASVHTGLNMNQQQATKRIIKAIQNPHTTMLAHLTGRLLLRRDGFPLDYPAVIDACATHGVILEINANPWRLELDWRWVDYALRKGVWISVNPDAHNKAAMQDMYYGVCIGRKGGLTKARTFNALSRQKVEAHFQHRSAGATTT